MDEQAPSPAPVRHPREILRIATRLAYVRQVEEESRRRLLRPLTVTELVRALRRYTGD